MGTSRIPISPQSTSPSSSLPAIIYILPFIRSYTLSGHYLFHKKLKLSNLISSLLDKEREQSQRFTRSSITMASTTVSFLCLMTLAVMAAASPVFDPEDVDCVVQAFGSGLGDKGIRVHVNEPGCLLKQPTISNHANFVNGEAEVALKLPTVHGAICMSSMNILVTLPYNCVALKRTVTDARYGNGASGLGSCRALQQRCGHSVSNAAIPYIDMYCRRPSRDGGKPEEMKITWQNTLAHDHC